MKKISVSLLSLAVFVVSNVALAHVSVKPSTVGIASFQTFTMSVPSEKELATITLRLALPDGLESVTPTVKPGWKIEVKKHDLPGIQHPYEIVWTGGNIPGHFRDEFTFSAKVPANPTTLIWKAYQTYSDGSVVAWNLDPKEQPKKADGTPDFSQSGPYSQTLVTDDLAAAPAKTTETPTATQPSTSSDSTSRAIAIGALLISLASLFVSMRRKKEGGTV